MDAPSFVTFGILALVIWFVPRLLFESVGRASDGISQLFVPPDRSMGWPHGVQESDAPWGWKAPARAESPASVAPADHGQPEWLDLGATETFLLDPDPLDRAAMRHGGLVVAPRRVRPN